MRSIMVDIETLSTKNDAAVVSIGLAAFNEEQVTHTELLVLSLDKVYGHIDPETVAWWMKQSQAARDLTFGDTPSVARYSPAIACSQMASFFTAYGADEVWANSPDFDLVILRNWWEGIKGRTTFNPGKFPVDFRAHRDCRTLFALAKQFNIPYDSAWIGSVKHDPVSDAACQARAVILIRKYLKNLRTIPL